jgi:hypothetical protein
MKGDVWEFNDYIRKVGDRVSVSILTKLYHGLNICLQVNFIYRKQSSSANNVYFEEFDDNRERISVARTGDHGGELLKEVNKGTTGLGASVYSKAVGRDPTNGNTWQTVDWPETIRRLKANGYKDAEDRVRRWLQNFYRRTIARQHIVVFRSYKYVANRAKTCGRR